jgi:3-hydroxyanthranilate 3,4-dioxygenase
VRGFISIRALKLMRQLRYGSDRLRWYCRSGAHNEPAIIREEVFHVTDLGTQLKPLIRNWIENPNLRECGKCGVVADAK